MELATVRDVAIIVLALESMVVGLVLVLLLVQVRSLTIVLQDEIQPILEDARRTVGTVKGTTSLVSETIVKPAVKIGQFSAGARRVMEVLLRGSAGPSDEQHAGPAEMPSEGDNT